MAGGAAQAASHSALVQCPARSRDSGKRFRFTPRTREHARNSRGGRQERERPQRPEAKGGAQADVCSAPPHARPRPSGPAPRRLAPATLLGWAPPPSLGPPLPSALEADFLPRKTSTGGPRRAAFCSSPSRSSRQEVVSGATRGRPPHGALAQPLV